MFRSEFQIRKIKSHCTNVQDHGESKRNGPEAILHVFYGCLYCQNAEFWFAVLWSRNRSQIHSLSGPIARALDSALNIGVKRLSTPSESRVKAKLCIWVTKSRMQRRFWHERRLGPSVLITARWILRFILFMEIGQCEKSYFQRSDRIMIKQFGNDLVWLGEPRNPDSNRLIWFRARDTLYSYHH